MLHFSALTRSGGSHKVAASKETRPRAVRLGWLTAGGRNRRKTMKPSGNLKDIEAAASRLRELHKSGVRRLYVMVTRASFSGLTRWVRVFAVESDDIVDVTLYVGNVCGGKLSDRNGCLELAVRGCGFSAEQFVTDAVNHRLGLPDGFAGGFKAARL
jgi:hypothetical protein